MTREQIREKIEAILDDFDKTDDEGLFIDSLTASYKIMELWDQGFVYDLPYEDRSGESMHETLTRMHYPDYHRCRS